MKKDKYEILLNNQKDICNEIKFDEIKNQISIRSKKSNRIVLLRYAVISLLFLCILTSGVVLGVRVIKTENSEYQNAIEFFELNELSTDHLTRDEIKEIYKDITSKEFKYRKTAEIIENSIKEKVPNYEIELGDVISKEINDAWELWGSIRNGECYNVSFIANGGILVNGDEKQVVYYSGEIVYPMYEKKGYIIKEYKINEDKDNKEIIVEVIWIRNPKLYLLEIYLEGEIYFSDYFAENEELNISLPNKEHYNLVYDVEVPSIMPKNDLKIELDWEIKKYTLTINTNIEQTGMYRYEYTYGTIIEEPDTSQFITFYKKGHVFDCWDVEFPFVLEKDTIINALWNPREIYLQFDGNGAEYIEFMDLYITYGEYLTLPKVTRDGFIFEGWYYYTELFKNGEFLRECYDNTLTLTAKWSYGSEYYTFGRYPQSHISDETLITELNNLTETNSYGYYEYNGEEYCKITAEPVVENVIYYSDGTLAVNKEEWFKVEPIKWYIVGSTTFTLSPVYLLDITCFDIENNPYSTSYLRTFLNNVFLYKAFYPEEIDLMLKSERVVWETRVDGTTATTTSKGIKDYVMAKSIEDEVKNLELTDYAIARGATVVVSTNSTTNITRYYGWWWIREQYQYSNLVYYQMYYDMGKSDFVRKNGNVWGIGINFSIGLEKI